MRGLIHRRVPRALSALVVLATVLVAAPAHADVLYVYDDLGRLIAVIDEASDTAIFRYDETGNLLAIERQSSATLAILEFRPKRGPVGTTVTIQGTGFSPVLAENTVTFNGTTATVTAATTTELVATVPVGATTGPIGVTTPSGAATSSASFEVTATTGAPSIVSFTPTVGTAGTAVTVNGTNFDTTPANDKLAFNTTRPVFAHVSAATSTSLTTSVPAGATSGRLWLGTPTGTTESADDFFVPPAEKTAADVVATGRLSVGGPSLSLTIGTVGKIALVVFDGIAGQRLSLGVSNSTITQLDLTVYRPDGTQFAWQWINPTALALDLDPLPVSGTYQVMIAPRSTYTGGLTLTLSEEITGTITIGGPSVTVSIPRPGQRARLTFEGTAGQRLSLGLTGVTVSNTVSILKADGTTLVSASGNNNSALDTPALPTSGTYAVLVDPSGSSTGSITLTLSEEVPGTIVVDGASVLVTISRPGQRARITFSGTAGQELSAGLSSSTFNGHASIVDAQGTTLAGPTWFTGSGAAVDSWPLPATGSYALLVDPWEVATGSVTLTLSEVLRGTITPGGAPVTVSITRPGQRAKLTFEGTAGQRVSMTLTDVTFGGGLVYLFNPDGTFLGPAHGLSNSFMEPRTLGQTGTHTLLIDPSLVYTGSATLTLYDVPPDVTGTLTVNGEAATAALNTPGQQANFSFTASAGTQVTARYDNSTIGCLSFSILESGGGSSISPCTASSSLTRTLSSTGTHTIRVDPSGTNTGTIDVRVTSP